MATKFCETCYREYLAELNKKTGGAKNVFIDTSRMTFKCQIPRFTHDAHGFAVVILQDCANRQEIVLRQEEWLRRRQAGEL